MAELSQPSRRWNGFVCPDCRHVFRVAKDHDGRGVVCPSCRRMLRLPGAGDEIPDLMISGLMEQTHHDPTADELAEQDGRTMKRRRVHKPEDIFDETFAEKEEVSSKFVRGLLGAIAVLGAVVVVVLLWPSDRPQPEDGSDPPLTRSAEPEKDELAIQAEREVVRPKLVEDEIQPVYEAFMNAQTPEEMARWVRHPELTLPRIKKFYGQQFAPVGFSSINWGDEPTRVGVAIKARVQDADYTQREIYAIKEDTWKIDWESWAGWSELSWEEIKQQQPAEPVLFRVVVSDVSYYNFSFSDESAWSSYRIESQDGEQTLFAYVPRASELDSRMKSHEGIEKRPMILKIRYPENAVSDNQVEVVEIVTTGWLAPVDAS